MNEPTSYLRVLYCVLLIAATIEPMPHQELARCDGGIVVATDDESALKLLESAPAAQLLYFSLEDYRRAVRDLDAEQIEAAVHKRRERFSADPLAHGSRRLLELERRVLTCAAASAGDQEPLRRMEAALAGMRTISTDPIWDDAELTAVLMALLDAESKVVAELQGPAAPLAVDGESRTEGGRISPGPDQLRRPRREGRKKLRPVHLRQTPPRQNPVRAPRLEGLQGLERIEMLSIRKEQMQALREVAIGLPRPSGAQNLCPLPLLPLWLVRRRSHNSLHTPPLIIRP